MGHSRPLWMPYNTFIRNQPMPTLNKEFSAFCAQRDAQNTIQLNVRKWTLMLCDALVDNFKSRNHGKVGGYDAPVYKFYPEEGRKYFKVIMEIPNENRDPSRSVHAFVDKKTGEIYKSASWKSPAKGVRYDLRLIKDREWLLENADWSGGYLYSR